MLAVAPEGTYNDSRNQSSLWVCTWKQKSEIKGGSHFLLSWYSSGTYSAACGELQSQLLSAERGIFTSNPGMRPTPQGGSWLTCSSGNGCFKMRTTSQAQDPPGKGLVYFSETWGRCHKGEHSKEDPQVAYQKEPHVAPHPAIEYHWCTVLNKVCCILSSLPWPLFIKFVVSGITWPGRRWEEGLPVPPQLYFSE